MVEGQLHDILVVSRRFEDKRMNPFTQEIRKNPEGLAFDQELDLLKELQKRNPEMMLTPAIFHLPSGNNLLNSNKSPSSKYCITMHTLSVSWPSSIVMNL